MILWLLKLGITMLIHNKDDIEFVTEFPCFLGHPVLDVENKTIYHCLNRFQNVVSEVSFLMCKSKLSKKNSMFKFVSANCKVGVTWRTF